MFIKRNEEGNILIVSIYVDDLIYTSDNKDMIHEFKRSMMQAFDMTDLGKMRFFLVLKYCKNQKESSYVKEDMMLISWRNLQCSNANR